MFQEHAIEGSEVGYIRKKREDSLAEPCEVRDEDGAAVERPCEDVGE
jgi:hypothetical protein